MAVSPATALARNLTWKDFKPKDKPAPPPGEIATSALTHVELGFGPISVKPVDGKFKLKPEPDVKVMFQADSWVAKYVSTWDQDKQDALLDHEQIHYLIAAITARDRANELHEIAGREYDTSGECIEDVKASHARLDAQDIQDKYDDDTKGQPSTFTAEQTKWATAVRSCLATNKPLRPALEAVGLMPRP
ncbi:MAG: hypothetical protein KDE55_09755 [Novosphingobium sp.]|nr:hypothetical protein [Novosphingobium sp.]